MRILGFCFIVLLLMGCQVSRMGKVMNARYKSQVTNAPRQKINEVSIISTAVDSTYRNYAQEAKEGGVNSLFIYTKIRNVWVYSFHPSIPVALFTNAVTANFNKGLKQKLAGRHLELTIDSIPSILYFVDHKTDAFAATFGVQVASIQSCVCNRNLIVSYRVTGLNNAEVKAGTILVPDMKLIVLLKMFQTFETKMIDYFEQYDAAISGMTKKFMDKLVGEL